MNIIGQFLIYALLSSKYFKTYQRVSTKILFQIILMMCIYDILWIIVMAFVWNHDQDKNTSIKYWASLKVMHSIVYFIAFGELVLKLVIEYFVVKMNKQAMGNYFDVKNLFTLSYKEDPSKQSQDLTDSNRRIEDSDREKYKDLLK